MCARCVIRRHQSKLSGVFKKRRDSEDPRRRNRLSHAGQQVRGGPPAGGCLRNFAGTLLPVAAIDG